LVYDFQFLGILTSVAWLLSNLLEDATRRGVNLRNMDDVEADLVQFRPWRRRAQRWAFLLYYKVLAQRIDNSTALVPMRAPVWQKPAQPTAGHGLPPPRDLVPDDELMAALCILARLPRLDGRALQMLRWSDIHTTWRMTYINNPVTGRGTPYLTWEQQEALATLLGRALPADSLVPIDPDSTFLPLFRDMNRLPRPAPSRRPRTKRN
jgi:hypothetical protein